MAEDLISHGASQKTYRPPLKRTAIVGAGYLLAAYAGLHFSRFGAPIESVWLANVIVVWAMTGAPRRDWPVFVAAAAAAHVTAHLLAGDTLAVTLPAVVADMSECVMASLFLTARPGVFAMRVRADVWYFLFVSVAVATISAAMVWVGRLLTAQPLTAYDTAIWIAADSLAMIVFLPILKGIDDHRWQQLLADRKRAHAAQWIASIVVVSVVAALVPIPGFRLVLIPLLAAMVFEFGVAGAQVAMATLTIAWLLLALNGHSPAPWYEGDPRQHVVMAQYLAALISAAILPLAVTLEQKGRLTTSLSETLEETRAAWGAIIAADARYRLVVDYATEMVMRVAPDGQILFASKLCDDLSPQGKLVGGNLFALMDSAEAQAAKDAIACAMHAELYDLPQHWRYRLRRADGALGTYDARATLVAPGKKKSPAEFVFVLRPTP